MSASGKRLSQLLEGLAHIDATHDVSVQDVVLDSRAVKPGALFCALRGERHDGRAFFADAIGRGAAAIVYNADDIAPPALAVPAIGVPRLAR